jgi:hypothetical protein
MDAAIINTKNIFFFLEETDVLKNIFFVDHHQGRLKEIIRNLLV